MRVALAARIRGGNWLVYVWNLGSVSRLDGRQHLGPGKDILQHGGSNSHRTIRPDAGRFSATHEGVPVELPAYARLATQTRYSVTFDTAIKCLLSAGNSVRACGAG